MSNERRRAEAQTERDEGRAAFEAGKGMQSCPYKHSTPSWMQWTTGWEDAQRERAAEQSGYYYAIDPEQFQKLRAMERRLHGGSDRERDEGHRLWLILNAIEEIGLIQMPESP